MIDWDCASVRPSLDGQTVNSVPRKWLHDLTHQIRAFFVAGPIAFLNHRFHEVIERKRKEGREDMQKGDSK